MVWFAVFSFAGWLFESVYAVLTQHHWEGRGFLYGPICPIYGVGSIGALVLFKLLFARFGVLPAWEVFLICMVGSAILEYSISWWMEKAFGTVWWDYSNLPLNLHGRICLPASLLFGCAGLAVAYLLLPLVPALNAMVPVAVVELLALLITIAITVDTTLTITDLTNLLQTLNRLDEQMNDRMEGIVVSVRETREGLTSDFSDGRQAAIDQLRETASSLSTHQQAMLRNMRRFASDRTAQTVGLIQDARRAVSGYRDRR